MGYNISDVGGQTAASGDSWVATLDLSLSGATTVSGDFNVIAFFGGQSEATGGYSFSALSNPALGSLAYNTATGTYTFTADWDAVRATGADQVVSFTVTGRSGGSSDTDTVRINLLICVAQGTMIDTANGPVAVEDLRGGDLVVTMDNGLQPVRWVGVRRVTGAEQRADRSLRPVRLEPGALGEGRPNKRLTVSPQHRFFLRDWRAQLMFGEDQVLVPAKSLINDRTIRRDHSLEDVGYHHVLFDAHQIMFTDGVPTESFHPGAYALSELDGPVRDELLRLFPRLDTEPGYGETARPILRPWEANLLAGAASQASPQGNRR